MRPKEPKYADGRFSSLANLWDALLEYPISVQASGISVYPARRYRRKSRSNRSIKAFTASINSPCRSTPSSSAMSIGACIASA